jgi:hypothetical protein
MARQEPGLDSPVKEIVERAAKRRAIKREAYQAKLKARKERELETGKKSLGKLPEPPIEGPKDKDQINLTDPESWIAPSGDKGFSRAGDAKGLASSRRIR